MLEVFKPKAEDAVHVNDSRLRSMVQAIFEKVGLPPDDAKLAADVLVTADLRGVESHGVSNVVRKYVTAFRKGLINPTPHPKVLRETAATAVVDDDRGLGIVTGPRAMQLAIRKAKETGVAVVTARNSGHLAMLAYHAMLPLRHDMIGLCMSTHSIGGTTVPTFGREPRLPTNPIAIAAPAGREHPFVFDVATSAIANNKIDLARRLGAPMRPGWIADADGNPIMEETPLPETFFGLPLGGTRELGSHKGYGLSAMVGIMSSLLAGSVLDAAAHRPRGSRAGDYSHHFAAYNIEAFTEVADFKENMDNFLRDLRSTPPAPGHDRVLYAGLLEAEEEQERRTNGIPLHREVVTWFRDTCAEMSIPFTLE